VQVSDYDTFVFHAHTPLLLGGVARWLSLW